MNILITCLVLFYLATCFFFHQVMLKLYAEDNDPELANIPDWWMKAGLFIGSLLWPVVALGSWIHKVVKK